MSTAEDFDIYEDTGERQDRLFPKAEPTGAQQQSVAQVSTDVVRHLPAELKAIPNFLLWAMVQVSGKLTKKPLQIDGTAASSTNPATWASYQDVCRAQPKLSSTAGIGLALGKIRLRLHVRRYGWCTESDHRGNGAVGVGIHRRTSHLL